jgi:hypothetical protein
MKRNRVFIAAERIKRRQEKAKVIYERSKEKRAEAGRTKF